MDLTQLANSYCTIFFPITNAIRYLKGLAQAKIIKKSVILFRVLNMTI